MAAQPTTSTEERQGLLHADIDGDWTVSDFMELMRHLDLAVRAVWALLHPEFEPFDTWTVFLRDPEDLDRVAAELHRAGAQGAWFQDGVLRLAVSPSNAEGVRRTLEQLNVESIEPQAESWLLDLERRAGSLGEVPGDVLRAAVEDWLTKEAPPLGLRSLHFGSPGWIEVIHALNPLKTVENLISAWRHENTLRAQQAYAAEASRRGDRSERERTLMAFQLELLKQTNGQLREDVYAPLLLEVSLRSTEALAEDPRLKDVQVRELDE